MAKAQNARTRWSDSEWSEMLTNHVKFEILRFREAADLWEGGAKSALRWLGVANADEAIKRHPKQARELSDMLRESCLLHLRLLLDFFYRRKNAWPEDVCATDFVPFVVKKEEPDWLPEWRDRLDSSLAHLTLKRLRFKPRPCWGTGPLDHMRKLIEAFITALPEAQRSCFQSKDPLA